MTDRDRITQIRVQGLRALSDVTLDLNGLTVLIGDNGTGKSSIIEALELLAKTVQPGTFVTDQLGAFHGGLESLLRAGARELRLAARIDDEGGSPLEYEVALAQEGRDTVITSERLEVLGGRPHLIIQRDRSSCRVHESDSAKIQILRLQPGQLAVTALGAVAPPEFARALAVFSRLRVHVPFDVRPLWVAAQRQEQAAVRQVRQLNPATELERLGENLADCYVTLKESRPDWEQILDKVRAGIGQDVTALTTPPAGRGRVELQVHFRGLAKPIPVSQLSNGELSYLGFVALSELGEHSLLAFDEPESHLHPQLVVRVVWLLEELARKCPVVLATHSDRLLDALSDPSASVVLCELDEQRATRLVRPNREALDAWLEQYRGLGALRGEGYLPHVMGDPAGSPT